MAKLFGTDGIRGVAGSELSGDLVYRVGRATVVALGSQGERRPHVAVGRDTRASGEFLEAALAAGICSAGGDAELVGVCPTPAIAFLTTDLGAHAGAVISASHNPAEYNGIKLFGPSGYKVSDEVEEEIASIVASGAGTVASGRSIGRIAQRADATERYLEHLEAAARGSLSGLHVVVDCANGAASVVAPEILRRLGARVTPIHDAPDGWNINEGCGATEASVVAAEVVRTGADVGVTHDGDADRALFADAEGHVIDGDQILAACALDLQARGELDGDRLVTTSMANLGLHRAMRATGIEVLQTKVGDRYVLEEMVRSGAVLGGEQSGHVIFRREATTGDGLLTAVEFLTLANRSGQTVERLAGVMQKFPQVLVNVPVGDRDRLEGSDDVWEAVRDVERTLGEGGRVLVRPSGTEPLVRVMVEAATEDEAVAHAERISEVVRRSLAPA